ncbi:uncharacterized protein LOC110934256 [Helianthus annuus]|uniref:uncharacterized protein LOC110934256 n=1 Tax=Helianthus annuus TaxID=4232 RepID=UPI001652E578|nr:uncharacterized protein LOC110934256 [Helianthus annuus]
MLMHGFPIFSFIYLPVFYTTPNPRERWSEREREKCDGEGDVVWTTARTPAAGEHHHRSSLPPYEHHWSSLPLPNTTTGVPCRRLTPPEFPAAARTPPEFRGAARTPSEFLAVHRSTSNVHLGFRQFANVLRLSLFSGDSFYVRLLQSGIKDACWLVFMPRADPRV